MSPKLSLPL